MVRIRIERAEDGYRVLTSVDGSGWWGVGVTFPMWVLARNVAGAIALGFPDAEIIDESVPDPALQARADAVRGRRAGVTRYPSIMPTGGCDGY